MSTSVVIGIGNDFRRDDAVGLVVAGEVAKRGGSGVRVVTSSGEPGELLDAWAATAVAVVVDSALGTGAVPGLIRRWTPGDSTPPGVVSSHSIGLPQAYALGEALGRTPDRLVVLTVDIAEAGHGVGLTPPVAAAVPATVDAVLAEFGNA